VVASGEPLFMKQWMLKLLKSPALSLIFRSGRFGYSPCMGVFPSWSAAVAAIPPNIRVGFDQEESKTVFTNFPTTLVRPSDYPMLMHLREIVKPGMRVVDLGGSIGVAYYNAIKYFPWPEKFEWILCDVPAVIEAAREVALREGAKSASLGFVSDLADAGACDIFVSTGSLQLIEDSLPKLLSKLPQLPQKLLINRVAVWEGEDIFTLSDMGYSLCPYKVANRQRWVQSVEQLGYKLIDDWSCPESTLYIRFHRSLRLHAYHGFYFSRAL